MTDPTEHNDLSEQLPEVKKQLAARLEEIKATSFQTAADGDSSCMDGGDVLKKFKGFWGPCCSSYPA